MIKFIILFISFPFLIQAQDDYDIWDSNFRATTYTDLMYSELEQANLSAKQPENEILYFKVNKVRFKAKYLGEKRFVNNAKLLEIQKISDYKLGEVDHIYASLRREYLFELDGEKVWIPVNLSIEQKLNSIIPYKDDMVLYVIYMNYHNKENRLIHMFILSEFYKIRKY